MKQHKIGKSRLLVIPKDIRKMKDLKDEDEFVCFIDKEGNICYRKI